MHSLAGRGSGCRLGSWYKIEVGEDLTAHEDFSRLEEQQGSSDRSFGFVFALFFLALALWPAVHRGVPRWWALAVSVVFLLLALARPSVLSPLNRMWTRLARALNKIVNPVVTAALFYLVFTPVGVLMRLTGADPLRLRFDKGAKTYWIEKQPPGPPPETMARQF